MASVVLAARLVSTDDASLFRPTATPSALVEPPRAAGATGSVAGHSCPHLYSSKDVFYTNTLG
eukprot:4146995-Pyramimonas_sp.AAC.2